MTEFRLPADLIHNNGLITDPGAYARDTGAAS